MDASARMRPSASASGRSFIGSASSSAPPACHPRFGRQDLKPKHRTVCNGISDLAGVLIFSAVPFVVVQAFADSDYGKRVYEDLKARKKGYEQEAKEVERARELARQKSRWYGPNRPKWLGPIQYDYPEYLKGDVPGDYGFDLLRLGENPETFAKYYELEMLHSRWAMLAALGVFVPDLLQRSGSVSFVEATWWKVGYAKLQGEDLNYLGIEGLRIAGAQGVAIIALCQVLLMVGPEYARACGIDALEPVGIYLPGDLNYPGSFLFDPLGLSKDPTAFEDLRVKEVKNGRLAMVAWLGFYVQALVTKASPVDNLLAFLDDPAKNNVFSYLFHR